MPWNYAIKHMRRSPGKSMAIVLLAMAFVVLLLSLRFALDSQQAELTHMMEEHRVEAVASNVFGTKFDNLNINDLYITLLRNEDSTIAPFIKEICFKRSINCRVQDASGAELPSLSTSKLIGITRPSADSLLAEETISIEYLGDYAADLFAQNEPICLVSEELYAQLGEAEVVHLDFSEVVALQQALAEEMAKQDTPILGGNDVGIIELRIAGIVQGGIPGNIYCPWNIITGLDEQINGLVRTDSLSFAVADNRRLNELKELLRHYFLEVTPGMSVDPSNPPPPALTIRDAELVRVVSPLERSILFLQAILPVLLVLAVGIGFLASFLFIRNRRQEFAIMRSLGTKKHSVFLASFGEQLLLSLLGVLLGVGVMAALGRVTWDALLYGLLFLACFLAGSAVAVIRLVSVNVMLTMKAKE